MSAAALRFNGPFDLHGQAVALFYASLHDADQLDVEVSAHAKGLHLEQDHSQSLLHAAGASVDVSQWTDSKDYENATLDLTSIRAHAKLEVLSLAGTPFLVAGKSDCLNAQTPRSGSLQADKYAQTPRPTPTIAVDASSQLEICAGTTTLTGAFQLVLWEANLTVQDIDGRQTWHAGSMTAPAHGPEGASAGGVHQTDQLYLNLTQATLVLHRRAEDSALLDLYALDALASAMDGSLVANDAQGTVYEGGNSLAAQGDFSAEGQLTLDVHATHHVLQAHLSGTPTHLSLDDTALPVAAFETQTIRIASPWMPPSMVALAVTAAAVVLTARKHRHRYPPPAPGSRSYEHALHFFMQRRLTRALHAINHALQRDPAHPDYRALKARILYEKQDYDAALVWAEKADDALTKLPHKARNALLASMTCARLGDPDNAGCWLQKALQADPRIQESAERDQRLLLASRDARFRRWIKPLAATDSYLGQ